MFGGSPIQKAFLAPFITFMALLALGEMVAHLFDGWAFWMVSAPRYWVFPLQTVICGVLLWRNRRHYPLSAPARPLFTVAVAVGVFALWISPQEFFHATPRTDGFDPAFFGPAKVPYQTR